MASASVSASFYVTFQALKNSIIETLDTQSSSSISKAGSQIALLRQELNAALPSLPAYDQRSYDLVKELEGRLRTLRIADKPKSRFAFTKRPASSTPTPPTPAVIPRATRDAEAYPELPSTTYTLSGRKDVRLTTASLPSLVTAYTLTLSDLEGCWIDLRSHDEGEARLTSLHALRLKRCVLLAPVISGSIMMSGLEMCVVIVGGQQFRLHTSIDTIVLLNVASLPVIEHCSRLLFGAYPASFNDGSPGESKHTEVQDFDWVRPGPSPNWKTLPISSGIEIEQELGSNNIQNILHFIPNVL